MSEELPAVARLYYSGSGHRRYKRASTRSGPGEPLCFVSVADYALRRRDAEILTDWGFEPTHWMPLPKAPTMQEGK